MDKGICVYSIVSMFNQYSITPWFNTVAGFGCPASNIKYKWMSNKLFSDSVVGKKVFVNWRKAGGRHGRSRLLYCIH